jgi:hypothetical protein
VAQFFDSWGDVAPLIEAEGFDTSDFYGPAVELNQYPDKTVGLPLGLFPSFTFYNKDMFDAAGLDYPTHDFADASWNLDKLRELAMELTLDANGNNATSPDFDPENIVQWGWDDSWTDARFLTRFGAPNVGCPARKIIAPPSPMPRNGSTAGLAEQGGLGGSLCAGCLRAGSARRRHRPLWLQSGGDVQQPHLVYERRAGRSALCLRFAPTPYNQQGGRIAHPRRHLLRFPRTHPTRRRPGKC